MSKILKKVICFFLGHRWGRWIWAEQRDYACSGCSKCNRLRWGATLEYARTFPDESRNYQIITRKS